MVKLQGLKQLNCIYAMQMQSTNIIASALAPLVLKMFCTHSPHLRQVFGIIGFIFTDSFLAYRYFKPEQSELKHLTFKMALAERLVKTCQTPLPQTRSVQPLPINTPVVHKMEKLPYQKPCYYCRHGYETSMKINTTFQCSLCKIPLHKPSYVQRKKDGSQHIFNCWDLHISNGKPKFRKQSH